METTGYNNPSTSGFSGNTEGIAGKASSTAHAAVDSIAASADQAVRKASPAIDRVATMAHQAVDKAAGAAAPAAEWLSQQGESLSATQKRLLDDTCKYVAANPLKSLGMAALAGFLLSRIILK